MRRLPRHLYLGNVLAEINETHYLGLLLTSDVLWANFFFETMYQFKLSHRKFQFMLYKHQGPNKIKITITL